MTNTELYKLKDGDIIRNIGSGNAYTVLRNTGQCVIAARTLEVSNGSEWELVYTTTPVNVRGLVEMITDLESLGWTFDEPLNEWFSPDGLVHTRVIKSAWLSRHNHNPV